MQTWERIYHVNCVLAVALATLQVPSVVNIWTLTCVCQTGQWTNLSFTCHIEWRSVMRLLICTVMILELSWHELPWSLVTETRCKTKMIIFCNIVMPDILSYIWMLNLPHIVRYQLSADFYRWWMIYMIVYFWDIVQIEIFCYYFITNQK